MFLSLEGFVSNKFSARLVGEVQARPVIPHLSTSLSHDHHWWGLIRSLEGWSLVCGLSKDDPCSQDLPVWAKAALEEARVLACSPKGTWHMEGHHWIGEKLRRAVDPRLPDSRVTEAYVLGWRPKAKSRGTQWKVAVLDPSRTSSYRFEELSEVISLNRPDTPLTQYRSRTKCKMGFDWRTNARPWFSHGRSKQRPRSATCLLSDCITLSVPRLQIRCWHRRKRGEQSMSPVE